MPPNLCGRPTFPATSERPHGDYESQKQYETNRAENISTMTIDFRVLYGRATTRPPIEKSEIETPSERNEQGHRQQPEHERFELRRHLLGNISGRERCSDSFREKFLTPG